MFQDNESESGSTSGNLGDEPYQSENVTIPFAKYAKKIDVKTLKAAMNDIVNQASTSKVREL